MTFLAPVALVALLAVPVIYLVHLLRGSRKRVVVPALFVWADLPRARSGRTQRRRPPFTLLLLLQLIAAGLAALALARPASPSDPPKHVALILDESASMQATDVSPSRFGLAQQRGLERLDSLRAVDQVSVISAGATATLLASGPPQSVRQAVNASQPGHSAGAVREALALASAQVSATAERAGRIVVITDAAWPTMQSVGPLAAPVEVVTVGGGAENQSVENLAVRMNPSGEAQTAFFDVANWAEHRVRVTVNLTGDGAPLDTRQIDVAARSKTAVSVPVPTDVRRVKLALQGHDALAADDSQEVLTGGGPQRDVVLSGRAHADLRRALESIPFIKLHVDDGWPQPALTVLDGTLPAQLPSGPLLLVDPPADSGRLLGVGLGSGARLQQDSPLLQGLDVGSLERETPSVNGVPGWSKVVLGTAQGPLLLEGKLEGHAVVALTFDPVLSGLEKSLAFPLLISNASSYLLAEAESGSVATPTEAFDPAESDIQPRPVPSFEQAPRTDPSGALQDRWPWLAGALLVLLGLEWVVFARRG
ncbi:MAG: BatA and WFA domain-containing protein [Chloroflexi bacterium]|nr:BatA and WFA domain-containing protein [Chloroflexota bacterium]MBV9545833.1 BatA and WFA domain-containing protein [Chloroflexota bacterium]